MPAYRPTPFARSVLTHCLRLRARQEHGDPEATVSPMWDHWTDGVYPDLRARAVERVDRDQIRLHSHVAALHSSMVFAFNLFLRFEGGSDLASAFAPILGPLQVRQIGLEWVPPGALLGELAADRPRKDETATGVDAVVWAERPDGAQVAILVEGKLSEGGFTHCGGRDSRANRRPDVCASAERFLADPRACYLTRPYGKVRDRRYWSIFAEAYGSVAAAFPGAGEGACPFAGDLQQPMRQHALALALQASGRVDEAWVVLVHHDRNPDVLPHWEAYRRVCADPSRLAALPASSVVAAGAERYPGWADYLCERYAL